MIQSEIHGDAVRPPLSIDRADRIAGALLGTAVGDALGLPREGLSRRRAARLFGNGPLRHRLVAGRGMVSDDTEHAVMVGQALLQSSNDSREFARRLAWRLRWWLARLPAGVGLATARAITRLWCGVPPERSGVWSAGNGPAMRAPLLGVCLTDRPDRLAHFVRASTRLTHVDPRAERGAWLIAHAAAHAVTRTAVDPDSFFHEAIRQISGDDDELQELIAKMREALAAGSSADEFAASLGLHDGVSGYIYHTVPTSIYCWLRSGGAFREAVVSAIGLGGDTDTVGAIVGALCGATVGSRGIPAEWISGLVDWPCSERRLRLLATLLSSRTANNDAGGVIPNREFVWAGQLIRNGLFLMIVLVHGFRRLLPPY